MQSANFTIKVVNAVSELKELHKIATSFATSSLKLSSGSTDDKVKKIFFDNFVIMSQIASIIDSKSDPRFSSGWEQYKVVVAYDSKYSKPQAIGVIKPAHEHAMKKCSKLFSLATAYWNIDSSETKNEEYKVKGAGYSIVKFCSESGKEFGSQGEIYLNSLDNAVTYYKDKLGFQIVGERDASIKQTPMYLDENAAKKLI